MRDLDLLIERVIFQNGKEPDTFVGSDDKYYIKTCSSYEKFKILPEYSSNIEDAYLILDKLKDSTMMYYKYLYMADKHKFSNPDDSDINKWHGSHENYCAAVCLAALNSVNFDGYLSDQIRDAIFSYNFYYGVI